MRKLCTIIKLNIMSCHVCQHIHLIGKIEGSLFLFSHSANKFHSAFQSLLWGECLCGSYAFSLKNNIGNPSYFCESKRTSN